jgi:predicted acetyltransferase
MRRPTPVVEPEEVGLDLAASEDAALLSNLLELYSHDLSDTFGLELGHDGRFGYQNLPLYWSEPERRFPFLIRSGIRVVGFAFATRGLPGSLDMEAFDVAEFFVLRRYRRGGVGRRAAFLLWNRFASGWIVRVSEANAIGRRFWARIIAEYSNGVFAETTRPGTPHIWRVFSFASRNRRSSSEAS